MIYTDFKELKLSSLALGCMRLPSRSDNNEIDMDKTSEMVAYAMKKGINYYDTAWGYHGGNSETVMGKILGEYPRDSYYLASKFPGYDASTWSKTEEVFETQLQKCGVDYFDFYLLHNVCEMNIDAYLDNEKYRIFDYLMEQKKQGRIRHLGFSSHGNLDTMKRFLDAHGKDMEFCQLQINWLDWDFQNAKEKVSLVASYGIPVWVMEPVRGGELTRLEDKHKERLSALRPDLTLAQWSFRFIQSIPEVAVTLSGMSDFQQVKENIETFETSEPLSKSEINALSEIADEMTKSNKLPCTKCRYCTNHCPMELDIPWLVELYNEMNYSGAGFIIPMAMSALGEKVPSSCIGCKACESVCPQNIKISEMMSDFAERIK